MRKLKSINKTEYIFVRLTPKQKEKLQKMADEKEVRVTEIIRRIIEQVIK